MRFAKLRELTFSALDQWRDGWVMGENSFSLRLNSHRVKAFFTWCVLHDYLVQSPFDKLESITVVEIPTLPLSQKEYPAMLSHCDAVKEEYRLTVRALILTMRWSGLTIRDAGCLRRDALGADNRPKTYRQKTGEFVYIKLRADVADLLRAEHNIHPAYFFWDKGKRNGESQAKWVEGLLRKVYDARGDRTTRGAQTEGYFQCRVSK